MKTVDCRLFSEYKVEKQEDVTMKKLALILALVLLIGMLAGCSNSAAPDADNSPASSPSTSADPEKLKIALVLPRSMNDGGWNAAAYAGLYGIVRLGRPGRVVCARHPL